MHLVAKDATGLLTKSKKSPTFATGLKQKKYTACKDLSFWRRIPTLKLELPIWKPQVQATLATDASSFGWGAHLSLASGEHEFARGFFSSELQEAHITLKELTAIRFALEAFWPELTSKVVRLETDATVVQFVVLNLVAKSPVLRAELKRLYDVMELYSISLQPVHVQGVLNVVADELSRRLDAEDYRFNTRLFQEFQVRFGPCQVDRFASATNAMLDRFWSWDRCPGLEGLDSFSAPLRHWRESRSWCNPPWSQLPRVVRLLRHSGAAATVVAPYWRGAPWMASLLELSEDWQVLQPAWDLFCPGVLGSSKPIGPPRWAVLVASVPLRPPRPGVNLELPLDTS